MDPVKYTVPELIDVWNQALDDLVALCEPLDEQQWQASSPCPGWTVGDIAAHAADIESLISGVPRADHKPAWDTLPHAGSPVSRFIEIGIDRRRGQPKNVVLDELRARIAARRFQLDATPEDAEVRGLTGNPVPLRRLLTTRTFDVWAHEQDIRTAVGIDGNWGSAPAVVSFQRMVDALEAVWATDVAAPAGSTAQISVTGPELHAELFAGAVVDAPTVHLTVTWPQYMRLSCGRIDIHDPAVRASLTITGDSDLADSLLEELAITP